MPAVAVGAAVFAGVEIGTVGLAAMSTFSAIAAVGAIAGGVGVITGNKDLMKVGSVMGLVGGIGALAQGSGALGSALDTSTAAEGAEQLSGPGAASAVQETTAPGAVAKEALADVVPNTAPSATVASGGTAAGAPPAQAGAPVAGAPEQLSGPGMMDASTATAPKASPGIFDTVKDFAKPMVDFAKNNQMLTYGMMQVGGAALQGLFDTTKASQKELIDARAALDRQRAANISAPIPQATGSGVRPSVYNTGPRPVYKAPTIGLLNGSVTGVPS